MDELNDNQNPPPEEQPQNPYSGQTQYIQPMTNQPNNIPPYQQIPPQPPYQYYYAEQNKPKDGNGMAIASMICGIVSLVLSCIVFLSIPSSIAAIILSIICITKKKSGKAMAIAGLVCGVISIIFIIALIFYSINLINGLNLEDFY